MGWSIRLINLEQKFHSSAVQPIVANDFNILLEDQRKLLNDLILTRYEDDSLGSFPSCDCGHLKGAYNEGMVCPKCLTPVQAMTEKPMESLLWIKTPDHVGPFLSPIAWILLSKSLTFGSRINLLEYLVTPTASLKGPIQKDVTRFLNLNIPRGINHFHEHFDEIMKLLYMEKLLKGKVSGTPEDILELINRYRDCIFTHYLPMPSKLGLITEKTSVHSYTDTNNLLAVDALRTITGAIYSPIPQSLRMMQSKTMVANQLMANFHDLFMKDSLGGKEGISRSHMFAGRLHHTFRGVIVSLSDNHVYDEIHIPWSIATMVLKIHILNKLFNRGFSPKAAFAFINEHIVVYHPLLDEIFQELIAESPYGGIPCTFGRNPTLVRGSIQLLRITKVKTDPEVNAISISVNILTSFNADFDGDSLNGIVILDDHMYQKLRKFAPHYGVLDTRKPRTISHNLNIHSPLVSTIDRFVYG